MNMFTKVLEEAFDNYFHALYPDLTQNSPLYLDLYRNEAARFANFLVSDFSENEQNTKYWQQRFENSKND